MQESYDEPKRSDYVDKKLARPLPREVSVRPRMVTMRHPDFRSQTEHSVTAAECFEFRRV